MASEKKEERQIRRARQVCATKLTCVVCIARRQFRRYASRKVWTNRSNVARLSGRPENVPEGPPVLVAAGEDDFSSRASRPRARADA